MCEVVREVPHISLLLVKDQALRHCNAGVLYAKGLDLLNF